MSPGSATMFSGSKCRPPRPATTLWVTPVRETVLEGVDDVVPVGAAKVPEMQRAAKRATVLVNIVKVICERRWYGRRLGLISMVNSQWVYWCDVMIDSILRWLHWFIYGHTVYEQCKVDLTKSFSQLYNVTVKSGLNVTPVPMVNAPNALS